MNFLQLVNRAKQECAIPGADLTTVVGQSRELTRLINWVVQSWIELQEEMGGQWDFLRKPARFNTEFGTVNTAGDSLTIGCIYEITTRATLDFETVGERYTGEANTAGATYFIDQAATLGTGDETRLIGKQTYSPTTDIGLTDFGSWRNESFRCYLKSAGVGTEIFLAQYFDYSSFRDFYLLGTRKLVTGRPLYITVAPDRSLQLGFCPNDVYVINGEYYRTPQVLAADGDIPIMPDRYHMGIVYKTMEKYGLFEVANEQITAGREGYSKMLNRMSFEQMPMVMQSGSLI